MDIGVTWRRDQEGAQRTADEVRAKGRRAEIEQLDLTRRPEAADVIDRLTERLGRIDVLVNNSGTGTMTPFLDLDLSIVRQVIDVDLVGPFLCAQRAARRMIAQGDGGRIINVTSVHEHQSRVRPSSVGALNTTVPAGTVEPADGYLPGTVKVFPSTPPGPRCA